MDENNLAAKLRDKKNLPKIIFLVLGLIIAFEAVTAIRTLSKGVPPPPIKTQVRPITGAQIVLATSKKQVVVDDTIPVQIRVDTGGHATNGTDIIIKFDPGYFEASKSALELGKIYQDYPVADVDSKTGIIKISGIASVQSKGFNGVGILADVNLIAKKRGRTTLSVDFKEGLTSDSNVIDLKTAEDLLQKVSNLEVNIK